MSSFHPATAPERRPLQRWACWTRLVVVAALAMPGTALPYSLDTLLRMPLERLLELQIAPRRAALADVPDPLAAASPRAGRTVHHAV